MFQSDTLSPSSHFAPALSPYPLQLLNYLSVLEKQIDKDTNPGKTWNSMVGVEVTFLKEIESL